MSATWSSRSGTRSDSRALRSGCPCGRRRARGRARGACDGEPQGRLGARRSLAPLRYPHRPGRRARGRGGPPPSGLLFPQDTVPVERAAAVLAPMPTQLAVGASPPESTSKTQGRRPLLPDAEGRIRVRVSDRMPPRFPAEGIPAGWTAKEFVGHASVELVRDEARLALRLRSERSSFALYRDVVVELNEFPFLSWFWHVVRLPAVCDDRDLSAYVQAGQVDV